MKSFIMAINFSWFMSLATWVSASRFWPVFLHICSTWHFKSIFLPSSIPGNCSLSDCSIQDVSIFTVVPGYLAPNNIKWHLSLSFMWLSINPLKTWLAFSSSLCVGHNLHQNRKQRLSYHLRNCRVQYHS